MNINTLTTSIALLLGGIFVFFKPLAVPTTKTTKEIPLFEIHNFLLYELDTNKLVDISNGEKALRYKNRYELYNFTFTDNTQKDIMNIKAKKGIYSNKDVITLIGDVNYARSDGVLFQTQKIIYNRKKGFIQSPTAYKAEQNSNSVVGSYLYYDINKQITRSKNVLANYTIQPNQNNKENQ